MGRLAGRRIVITGAGRGIGAAIASLTASEGALVVVNDLGATVDGSGSDPTPSNDVVRRIQESGGTATAHLADVSDTDQAEDLVQTAVREFGGVDVLINVAGILRDKMIFNMDPEEWDAVQRVHLRGTFNTTRAASRVWRAERAGNYRLINTTSIAGIYGAPTQPNYAAAKLGIVGFTYSCANALMQYGVTANCLCPGAMTRMAGSVPLDDDVISQELATLTPENVAPAVAYIASVESGWLTGQIVGAMGRNISLYSRPSVLKEIVTADEVWNLQDVFARFETAFRPATDHTENPYETAARQSSSRVSATAAASVAER